MGHDLNDAILNYVFEAILLYLFIYLFILESKASKYFLYL